MPSKLFLFETHPVTIGHRIIGSRWGTGTPFVPLLPRVLRKRFATVRLYYPWEVRKMVRDEGFTICRMDFLAPSLDTLERKVPRAAAKVVSSLRSISDWLERSPLRVFGSTIVVCAKKVSQANAEF